MTRDEEICLVLSALGVPAPSDVPFSRGLRDLDKLMADEEPHISAAEALFEENGDWVEWNAAVLHLSLFKRAAAWTVIVIAERYLRVKLDKSPAEERLESAVSDFCRLLE